MNDPTESKHVLTIGYVSPFLKTLSGTQKPVMVRNGPDLGDGPKQPQAINKRVHSEINKNLWWNCNSEPPGTFC